MHARSARTQWHERSRRANDLSSPCSVVYLHMQAYDLTHDGDGDDPLSLPSLFLSHARDPAECNERWSRRRGENEEDEDEDTEMRMWTRIHPRCASYFPLRADDIILRYVAPRAFHRPHRRLIRYWSVAQNPRSHLPSSACSRGDCLPVGRHF